MQTATTFPTGRILVVDDEATLLKTFRYCLENEGHHVATAQSAARAEQLLQQQVFDLCFIDLRLGESSALDLLPALKTAAPWMRIVVVTAYSSVDTAVKAMNAGAADYLVKPCSAQQLRASALQQMKARQMDLRLQELERATSGSTDTLQSNAPAMMQLLDTARQAAGSEASVLLLGESGTGKGVLARAIHEWSPRAKAPFATVNTPGLSSELFESELFGHNRGAFTGAVQTSPGRVSQADGGTLFLDEVGDVPLAVQPKLLRFIQDRQYERLGDPVTRQADVRLVAATNRDLAKMVQDGSFRQDLLYRLDVIRVNLPPLRERSEDIPALADRFLASFTGSRPSRISGFTEDARKALAKYGWPGNIRELRNVIERASILCNESLIDVRHLALTSQPAPAAGNAARPGAPMSLQELEREHIVATIAASATLEETAKKLGIDASTLYRKRKQYSI